MPEKSILPKTVDEHLLGESDEPPPSLHTARDFWNQLAGMVYNRKEGNILTQQKPLVYLLVMRGGVVGLCNPASVVHG